MKYDFKINFMIMAKGTVNRVLNYDLGSSNQGMGCSDL